MKTILERQYSVIGKYYKERDSETPDTKSKMECYLALIRVHNHYATNNKSPQLAEKHTRKVAIYTQKVADLGVQMDRETFGRIAKKDISELEAVATGFEQKGMNQLGPRDEAQLLLDYSLARQKVTLSDIYQIRTAMAKSEDPRQIKDYERILQDYEAHVQLLKGLVRFLEKGRVCSVESTH